MDKIQKWLDALDSIPVAKGWQRSLMDITGIKHHENMWSDIYQFFFDVHEEHHLDDLFIRSLEQVAGIPSQFLGDFKIRREYVAENNKRIDLLLTDKVNSKAIIIENKVYHTLDNDLNLYSRTIHRKGYKEVKVVVLGLTKYNQESARTSEIAVSDLSSITHIDLLDKVMDNISRYLSSSNPFHLYLLQEFHKNIKNLTHMIDPQELAFFCRQGNQEKIVRVHDVYRHIKNYIVKVMECGNDSILRNRIEALGLRPKAERDYVKYIFTDTRAEEQMMLTVFYRSNILRPQQGQIPHIYVVLEIQGQIMEAVKADAQKFKEILGQYVEKGVSPAERQGNNWWHYAGMVIPLTNLESDLPRLADIVAETINAECPLILLGREILKEL